MKINQSLQAAMSGKPLPASVGYLKLAPSLLGSSASIETEADLIDPSKQLQLFQYLTIKLLVDAGQLLQAKIKGGMPQRVAWNATTVELVRKLFSRSSNAFITVLFGRIELRRRTPTCLSSSHSWSTARRRSAMT
jgi:hypothetical protein